MHILYMHSVVLIVFCLIDSYLGSVIYTKVRVGDLFKNDSNFNDTDHLQYKKIKIICNSRDKICKASLYVEICAMRVVNGTEEFKQFENSCYLFLSNMCDTPGNEFFIVTDMPCKEYKASRRHSPIDNALRKRNLIDYAARRHSLVGNASETKTIYFGNKKLLLREVTTQAAKQMSSDGFKTYDVDESFDYHDCPHTCTDTYAPVCINVNRQRGKYFKLMHFINHCRGDMYYCEHYEEFRAPPDDTDEHITVSDLSWSFCAAVRYMQFARFAEVTSSMNHYGWLHGDQRYTKILEASERSPGYGRRRK